jgi:hypothetical protein
MNLSLKLSFREKKRAPYSGTRRIAEKRAPSCPRQPWRTKSALNRLPSTVGANPSSPVTYAVGGSEHQTSWTL